MAHDTLGTVLARLGRHAEAVKAYQRSLDLRPDDPDSLTNMGVALTVLGRFAEAEAAHRRAIVADPQPSLLIPTWAIPCAQRDVSKKPPSPTAKQ